MARKKDDTVNKKLAAQFTIAPLDGKHKESSSDVLEALLHGSTDDDDAVEADAGELANLQSEFDAVAALTRRKQELESELSKVSQALEAQKGRMLEAMEAQGTRQFRSVTGDGACTITERFDTTLDDPQAFISWVKEAHPDLLTVHSQTRNKFIREEYRDQGIAPDSPEFPPGVVVTPRRGLMVRNVRRMQDKDGQ